MNKSVIELAKQSGFWQEHINTWMCCTSDIEAFAQAIRNAALDEAAKHCQDCSSPQPGETQTDGQFAALHLAQQIKSMKS